MTDDVASSLFTCENRTIVWNRRHGVLDTRQVKSIYESQPWLVMSYGQWLTVNLKESSSWRFVCSMMVIYVYQERKSSSTYGDSHWNDLLLFAYHHDSRSINMHGVWTDGSLKEGVFEHGSFGWTCRAKMHQKDLIQDLIHVQHCYWSLYYTFPYGYNILIHKLLTIAVNHCYWPLWFTTVINYWYQPLSLTNHY